MCFGCVGEMLRMSVRGMDKDDDGTAPMPERLKDGGKELKWEAKECMLGGIDMSESMLEEDKGNGYSKRGETSNGVPRIDDGECRDRLDKLRRGFNLPAE